MVLSIVHVQLSGACATVTPACSSLLLTLSGCMPPAGVCSFSALHHLLLSSAAACQSPQFLCLPLVQPLLFLLRRMHTQCEPSAPSSDCCSRRKQQLRQPLLQPPSDPQPPPQSHRLHRTHYAWLHWCCCRNWHPMHLQLLYLLQLLQLRPPLRRLLLPHREHRNLLQIHRCQPRCCLLCQISLHRYTVDSSFDCWAVGTVDCLAPPSRLSLPVRRRAPHMSNWRFER